MTPFRFQTVQKNSAYASFFCTAVWKLNDVITMLYYWTMHASLCFNCLINNMLHFLLFPLFSLLFLFLFSLTESLLMRYHQTDILGPETFDLSVGSPLLCNNIDFYQIWTRRTKIQQKTCKNIIWYCHYFEHCVMEVAGNWLNHRQGLHLAPQFA